MEFKKSITQSFELTGTIKWTCPHCGSKRNETSFTPSPYRILADDEMDVSCTDCGEYVSLNFYEND